MLQPTNLFILNVQFCKSCPTHSWCTHHDQQKYLGTYKKLKQFLQQQFGSDIFVQGNVIPDELVPIKPAENKYFSTKTNKYVTFPSIGAFQVILESELIFSKKNTNTWPNFSEIAQIIHLKLHGQPRSKSPSRKHNTMKNVNKKNLITDVDIKTQKDHVSLKNQSFLDHNDKRSTFYKNRSPNQHKNFTLTDHFKNYHNGNYKTPFNNFKNVSDQYFTTANTDNENMCSEISSFRNGNSSEKEFLEFKKNFDTFGLEGKLPEFFKKKAFMKQNSGKKEMIIRLDSIEEQSVLMDENNPSYGQNINLTNTHTTFKSKSKENHKKLMKRFTDDFEQLEAKFKHFEQRVQTIREENKKFDQRDSSGKLNDRIMREINDLKKKEKRLRSSEVKQTPNDEGEEDEMMDNPIIFAKKKLKNIEDYINGTEQQKNEKLKKIYGEWKLLKKPYKGKNYVSPYKLEVSKRTAKKKNCKSKDENADDFSSSCSSSEQEAMKPKSKPNVPKNKLPGLKSSKSNQILAQDKFYSTAREKFQQLGSRKLNGKMSEKKFDSFSNNSAEKQFHRSSAGVKLNTFDHITQGQKDISEFNGDSRIEEYPHSFNHQHKHPSQKGKHLKSMPKKKTKGQFFTKQASSRQMNRSSRNIHMNEQAEKYANEDQKVDNQASVHRKMNSPSIKVKNNGITNKNAANSNSKSVEKGLAAKDKKRHSQDSSQESEGISSESQQESESEQVKKLHQNSPSLQDNFFASAQPKSGSVDKKTNSLKRDEERSIAKIKEWRTVDGQNSTKKTSHKRGRMLVAQNQPMDEKRKRRDSVDKGENQIEIEQQSLRQFTGENFAQSSFGYQNQVITTNLHKLSKKFKAQKESQISKAKKSAKINEQKEPSQKSESRDDSDIQNDSQLISTKRNSLEKSKQNTRVDVTNKEKIGSDQTIKLDKETQKQPKGKKFKTTVKSQAESEHLSEEKNRQDDIKDSENDFDDKSQQEEESDNLSQMQSEVGQSEQPEKVQNDKTVRNHKQHNINKSSKNKEVQDKKIKQQMVSKRKDQNFEITSQKFISGHPVNENKKNEQQSQSQLQRDSEQEINDGQTNFIDTKNQTLSNRNIEMYKLPASTQGSKKKKLNKKQSSIKPSKQQAIVNGVDHEEKMSENADEKGNQSLIESCDRDKVEQNSKQSATEKGKMQQKKKNFSLKQSQEADSVSNQLSSKSQEQSGKGTSVVQKAGKSEIQSQSTSFKKKQSITGQQKQPQVPSDLETHINNDHLDQSQQSSNVLKNKSNRKVSKENQKKQQHQLKAQETGDKLQFVVDQNESDEVNSKAIHPNKDLIAKDKRQSHKKTAKGENKLSQNHQEGSQNQKQESDKIESRGENFSHSDQSSAKDESESQSAKQNNSEPQEYKANSTQSNHPQVAIKNKQTKNQKHKQPSKQEVDEIKKRKSEQRKAKGQNSKQSDMQQQDYGQDRIQHSRSPKVGQQQHKKASRKVKGKKSSQIKNDGQSEEEQPSLDQEEEQLQSSKEMNEVDGLQAGEKGSQKNSKSQILVAKQKKTQKKSKNHVKMTKVQKVEVQQNVKQESKAKNYGPNESITTKNKAEESQSKIQNSSENSQSENDAKSQHSQDEAQLNNQKELNQHEQDQASQQRHDESALTSIKKSSKNKNALSNKTESQGEIEKPSKKAQTINSSSLAEELHEQDSQHSHDSQEQSEESSKQKSFESSLNTNSETVNETKQKRQHKQKVKKSVENDKVREVNVSIQKKRKDEKQQAQVGSVHESEKQKENTQNIDGQVQENGPQAVSQIRDNTNSKDAAQASKSKKQKYSQNNNKRPPVTTPPHQQPTEQRPIGTGRSTRNKILNVYQTDRCKDHEEGSDEEELAVSKNCKGKNLEKKADDANDQSVVNGQKIFAKESHSKDVGIQMDNQQVRLKKSSLNKNEDTRSVKRNSEGEGGNNQSDQGFIRQQDKQNGDIEERQENKKTIDKQELKKVDMKDELRQSNLQKNGENSNERQENTELQKDKPPQVQESSPTALRNKSINQPTSHNFTPQSQPHLLNNQLPHNNSTNSSPSQSPTPKYIRAPITKQFYGASFSNQLQIYPSCQNLTSVTTTFTQLPQNSHMSPLPYSVKSRNWVLFNQKSIEVQKIHHNHAMSSLMKCVKILAEINEFLVVRLFEDPFVTITHQSLDKHIFGVWLCINNQWRCVLVNLKQVLISQQTQDFYYMTHHGNQLWPMVLQKALSSGLGSYSKLNSTPCYKLFSILTGSNSLFFNIKQDPTKNSRILRYISDCENKNFVIHAEKVFKNLEELENKDKQTKIYYVLSQRTVNESDTLLQIRDSTKPQSQWTKLSKFVQEFKSIQILQLRINHNFSSLALPKPTSTQSMTIVSLDFDRESFGSITLSTEPYPVSLLRTFLYKEEKSNYLKLIGQAQEKNKATLFFDCCFAEGKYWLFVDCGNEAKITYLGENEPKLQLIEEIKGDGLKNDWTEYLPVKTQQNNKNRAYKQNFSSREPFKMPNKLNMSKFNETGMSFKSQDDKISRLRQNFIDYLLKDKEGV